MLQHLKFLNATMTSQMENSTPKMMWWVTVKTQMHKFTQSQREKDHPSPVSCNIFFMHAQIPQASMPKKSNKMACVQARHTTSRFPMIHHMDQVLPTYCVVVVFLLNLCSVM